MSIKNEVNESVFLMNDFNYAKNHSVYRNVDKMMAFGGDNFKGLCEELDLNGKKAFTVCGSGDQSIELAGRGFTHIDVFDINIIARHMLNLKIAAIMVLEYDEFMIFSKKSFRDEAIFKKIVPFLNSETKEYFELLFRFKNRDYVYRNLLTHKYTGDNAIIEACQTNFSIYNCKGFYLVKEKLLKTQIRFNQRNLFEPQKLDENYDFIYFSNILLFSPISIKHFKEELLPNYVEHLNPNGILAFYYMHYYVNCYDNSMKAIVDQEIRTQDYNDRVMEELEDITNMQIILEPSCFGWGTGDKDLVLALRKENG